MNRILITAAICLFMLCSSGAGAQNATAGKSRPNVVVFVADDLGWRDLGYAGSTFYESPHIDTLAARGMVFTSAYSACTVCSPTRAALMTGRYPARVGVTDFIGGPQPAEATTQPRFQKRSMLPAPYRTELPLEETTIAEAFKAEGYATFFAGKWHLGNKKFYPSKQGFDDVVSGTHAGNPGKDGFFSPYHPSVGVTPGPVGEHLDLRLATDMAKWIAARPKGNPFLAYYAFYDVHTPLLAPPKTVEHFEAKRKALQLGDEFAPEGDTTVRLTQSHAVYAAMIKTMDDAVGIVVNQLEASGALDNTIIVFTSDNGGLATAEGQPTSNQPLRAGKGWAYEGGIRVPLIVVAPGLAQAGSTSDTRAISTDLFPTLLAACGLAARPKDHLDGTSLLPTLQGKPSPDRPLFWHYPHYGNQGGSPHSAVRSGNWKLIAFHDTDRPVELYDLAVDPGEKNNRAEAEPARVKTLTETLNAWKKSVGAIDATVKPENANR